MSATLTTLKERAAQVRGATGEGENTAERIGRLFVGILALMEESEVSFEPSEGYDTLETLKELAVQVRSATEDSENTAERVGRAFVGILNLLEQSGFEFEIVEGGDSIEVMQTLSGQVRGATRKGENTAERIGRIFVGILDLLAGISADTPTNFLVRSDLPDVFYSSTQSALDAVKAAYPSGLTRDVTITCVKTAKEPRTGGVWIASLSDWNMGGMHCLAIDGAGLLTYDGKSLGCLQFKFVSNVIIRNTAFWDYANQATATTPDECEAVGFNGDKNRPARNLYIEKCLFSGVSRADNTKLSTMSVNCYNVENIFFNSCKFSGNYGVTVSLNDCSFSSFVKNDINVAFSNKVIAHPVAVTASEGEYMIFEDNEISGDIREVFVSSYNISQFICRRNKFMDGGGQALIISSAFGMKRVSIESNLFVGMNKQPVFEWLKECVSLGGTIDKAEINNNTLFANSTYYELYAFRGGDIGDLDLHNNILVDATTGKTLNGFVFTTVKSMRSGNNLYRKDGTLLVVTNPSGLATSINIDWNTGRDLAKIQALGYERNSVVIAEGVKVLDIQNGGTTYAITEETDALYHADNGCMPSADVGYKSPSGSVNSIGCYTLHGTAIDETAPAAGYAGDNITDDETFSSNAQYSFMADSMLVLMHNTRIRDMLVRFSITGPQHRYLVLGKYGSVSPYPVLDDYGEYTADELYTINID